MPGSTEILAGLAATARGWWLLAVLWHGYFALFALAVALGWRPSNRVAGAVLIPPVASVSLLAWIEGNPFNGAVFAVLSLTLLGLLRSLSPRPVAVSAAPWLASGIVLLGFGWAYPHFLEPATPLLYLVAAPLGLIPCPSLSVVVGLSLVYRGLASRAWSRVVAVAAVFYGIFGAVRLGVTIDWLLTGGGIGLFMLTLRPAGARG